MGVERPQGGMPFIGIRLLGILGLLGAKSLGLIGPVLDALGISALSIELGQSGPNQPLLVRLGPLGTLGLGTLAPQTHTLP